MPTYEEEVLDRARNLDINVPMTVEELGIVVAALSEIIALYEDNGLTEETNAVGVVLYQAFRRVYHKLDDLGNAIFM